MARRGHESVRALKVRVHALEAELEAVRDLRGASGIVGEDYLHRYSLGQLRNRAWAALARTISGLPQSVEEMGAETAYEAVGEALLADLYALELVPPISLEEAEARDDLRRVLSDPVLLGVLAREGHPGYSRVRAAVLTRAAEAYYRPSFAEVFRRAVELVTPEVIGGEDHDR